MMTEASNATVDVGLRIKTEVKAQDAGRAASTEITIAASKLNLSYGDNHVLHDVTMDIEDRRVTAFIGPSGCGKSTLLRCFNRMNDLIDAVSVTGSLMIKGVDVLSPKTDVIEVRRRIGMVFQKSNPFPKSIYENVVYGLRIAGIKDRASLDEACERSLRGAGLWDEVKDKLKKSAFALSGGQQQRLCIARTLAVAPDVVLMDEPCSALDPIATSRIEDLMVELKRDYTIVIVTHNMQQAARVSDMTAFMTAEIDDKDHRVGRLVEYDATDRIFTNPSDSRTEGYITGRFG
jgi:phosphate transport system ATP-binding protein